MYVTMKLLVDSKLLSFVALPYSSCFITGPYSFSPACDDAVSGTSTNVSEVDEFEIDSGFTAGSHFRRLSLSIISFSSDCRPSPISISIYSCF